MGRRRYTEQQFRDAVDDPTVTTIAELCRRLGLVPRGGNYGSLRSLGAELDIDVDGVLATRVRDERRGEWRRPWTADELREAVSRPDVRDMREVCEALGVSPRTKAYRRIERVAAHADVDISHIAPPPRGRHPIGLGVSRDRLRALVDAAETRDDVLDALGIEVTQNSRRRLARAIARMEIDTNALAPSRALGGASTPRRTRKPLEEYLQADTTVASSHLRRRLVQEGVLPRRCTRCGGTEWEGSPMPLELDHVDGDRRNNRLDNLRLLCPNCHALTPTYRGRNIGQRRGSRRESGSRGRAGTGDTGTA